APARSLWFVTLYVIFPLSGWWADTPGATVRKSGAGMLFRDQVALITGASSGIGRATAEALAREGARVGVNYCKNQAGAEQTAESIRKAGGEALVVRADVTRAAEVLAMVDAVRAEWGRIDILVNNAGDLLARRSLSDMTEEYWDQIMALNLKSVFLCVRAVWQEMAERKTGCIINVTSIAGRNGGGPGAAAYAAAKGGLLTYTKGLAKELAPHGIRVNGIAPGVIATPYHERYSPGEVFQRFIASIPLGRAGTSEEIADVIVFLASPAARYITGETIEVNGGMLMD
ncbi:MAG: 3-oxoacyl-ACP reductase family protein, partial [Terriglobia bacterium]